VAQPAQRRQRGGRDGSLAGKRSVVIGGQRLKPENPAEASFPFAVGASPAYDAGRAGPFRVLELSVSADATDWLLVDGSSLIFRAFFGVKGDFRGPNGERVNAVRGFLDRLATLITERRPRFLAVASDDDWRPAWRVEVIASYKQHRVAEPIPPQLEPQMPIIHGFLDAIGVDFVGVPDFEAEDVIASWVARIQGPVEIVSGDRDLFALVRKEPKVAVLYPEKGGLAVVDEAEVERRYGIPGRAYTDYAILRGDPSDGLPGMAGVGDKKAAELVRRYGGVAGLLAQGKLASADRDYLERAMAVVPPRTDIPIDLPPGRRIAYPVDPGRLAELQASHGLQGPSQRLITALERLA
jgi:5'-3' exonuclease